ncbi:hypothetical protein LA080_001051 [Diaporthe eres]|nr:hypothetical protein LA080_001051 [Diaporthe eres]
MRFRETFGLLGEAGCHVRFPSNRIVAICIATSSPALQICFADLGFLDLRIGCPATKEIRDVGNHTACCIIPSREKRESLLAVARWVVVFVLGMHNAMREPLLRQRGIFIYILASQAATTPRCMSHDGPLCGADIPEMTLVLVVFNMRSVEIAAVG